MTKTDTPLLVLILTLAAPAAFPQDPAAPVEPEREPLAPIVRVNNRFALETYRRASADDGNLFLSPASIRLALEMILAGTAGPTQTELEELLHPGWEGSPITGEGAELAARLAANPPAGGKLSMVSALWLQEGAPHRSEYVERIAEEFGAETALVDFAGAPAEACEQMNAWVSRWTESLISGGWRPESIDPRLEILVSNALHLQAPWQYPFRRGGGKAKSFWITPEGRVAVETMSITRDLRHFRDPRMEAVVIPYRGADWSMIVVLPEDVDAGLAGLERELTAADLTRIARETKPTRLRLVMPPFELRTQVDVAELLTTTRQPLLFQAGKADLSAMTDRPGAFLGGVDHDAYIKVDEKGTEVTAVTRGKVYRGPGPPPPPTMLVNQPFLFAILHEPTGTLLALGKLTRPVGPVLPDAPYPIERPWRKPTDQEWSFESTAPVGRPTGPPPIPRKGGDGD